jgi:DNA repair protein RecN (Recombination protein N)
MITSLSVENFALIEKLNIHFSDSFTTITGETGAGKSILLGALGLVLGKRADLSSLKNQDEKCIVEAVFSIKDYQLESFFEENDIDYDDQTIIRREILPSGKSRAFINDSPANLQQVQDLSIHLIDIHSQNQTLELTNEEYQIEILDAIASNSLIIEEYKAKLKIYKQLKSNFKKLLSEKEKLSKEDDYTTFLLNELQNANLISGEQINLEMEVERLNNIESIKESIEKSLLLAEEEQFGVVTNVKEIRNTLQKIASFSSTYDELLTRVSSLAIELNDIVQELNKQADNIVHDPEHLLQITDKLQLIYTLQKKHQVTTIEELLDIQGVLENKVFLVQNFDSELSKIEKEISEIESQLNDLSLKISNSRKQVIPSLSEQLVALLSELGMPNARFEFQITTADAYLENGIDQIQLLFSANKGSNFGLLKKVASGGEMSRIMLAIKAVLSKYSKLPTIIFDEIDTGVSGEVAIKMGVILKSMSLGMQVFAITHLPQIAAKGSQQLKVYKTINNGKTTSELKLLNTEERINEIAEMLSGKTLSASAIQHAKSLL